MNLARTLSLGLLFGIITLGTSAPAYTAPAPEGGFAGTWNGIYPGSDSLAKVVASTGTSCQLCHVNVNGGANNYNGYGWKMREFLNSGASTSSAILQSGPFNSDMNPAGSSNLEEIDANTQPGWVPGPHNTLFFTNGSTQTDQSPPAIDDLDPPLFSLYGCGTNPSGSMSAVSGGPVAGTTFVVGLDNPLSSQASPALSVLAISLAPDPNFPCGTPLPGWGMSGPFGELLISLSSPNPLVLVFGAPWFTAGSPAQVSVPIPSDAPLLGLTLYFQGVLASNVNTLTEGMQITIGY
jgi:hypothetical protein